MSDLETPFCLAIERLIALVTSDQSLEQPIKDAFIKDITCTESSSFRGLREVLLSYNNGATNGNTVET